MLLFSFFQFKKDLFGLKTSLISSDTEPDVDCKVDILVEADIKRRSHQRAEQIKKAREEFLGISTEEVFSEAETAPLKNICPQLRHLGATTRTNNEAYLRYSHCHLEIS